MTHELYKQYRPTQFKDVLGQEHAVRTLSQLVKTKTVPHAMLFAGPSGCGKTTLVRILARKLGCGQHDLTEVNCAKDRGIDLIRGIESRVSLAPISGTCRVWILDECHQCTEPAQQSLLKLLEDTPPHAYFFLATTDPHDLLQTIRTRCTDIKVGAIGDSAMEGLLRSVCTKARLRITDEVIERIVGVSEGSARKALVILNQIKDIEDADAQFNAIESQDIRREAIQVARALFDTRTDWKTMSAILKGVREDPEQLRWLILSYADRVLLSSGSRLAYEVIRTFRNNFYSTKKAGLTASCWEIIVGLRKSK